MMLRMKFSPKVSNFLQAYMRKTSDVAGMAFLAKKTWRKIWPKNGLKLPKIAKIWPKNGLKWPKIAENGLKLA